jgi:hypothetical protein
MPDSKFDAFLESYNKGFDQYQATLVTNFFFRIQSNIATIQAAIQANMPNDNFFQSKMAVIASLAQNNSLDAYSRIKGVGLALQEIAPVMKPYPELIKQHLAIIINSYFQIAKETEDEQLLQMASSISASAS